VLRLTYPYQPALRDWGKETTAAQQSVFAMPAPMFYELHPFHLVMDRQLQLLQWGASIGRVVPDLQAGQHVRHFFKVRRDEGVCCGCQLCLSLAWLCADHCGCPCMAPGDVRHVRHFFKVREEGGSEGVFCGCMLVRYVSEVC
jgi:hypothetical protein